MGQFKRDKLKRLYARLKSLRQVGRVLGVSRQTVLNRMIRLNLNRHTDPGHMSHCKLRSRKLLLRAIARCAGPASAAAYLRVSRSSFYAALHRLNVTPVMWRSRRGGGSQ